VQLAATGLTGLPPIEVYQIGEAYFVLDGNHRVSVARRLGASYIEAYVTEIHTKVPLSPNIQPDDLIIKARYADFLERTSLNELRPDADLSVTVPGQYRVLEEQIKLHAYYLSQKQQQEVPFKVAAADWYDHVYLPVVEVIRDQGLLRDFPGRTETDVYTWISRHREALEKELGWSIKPEAAASDLVAHFSPRPQRVIARMGEKLLEAVTPNELEAGPAPGQWRKQQVEPRHKERLFSDILVAISGQADSWVALEYALEVARREEGHLYGLHIVSSPAAKRRKQVETIRNEFQHRCAAAHLSAEFVVEVGGVAPQICRRAWWTDLVVVSLTYPPAPQLLARLGSGFRTLMRRCARPVLAIPAVVEASDSPDDKNGQLSRALLAYDGSSKSQEALFVATYLAGRWRIPLVVVTVLEKGGAAPATLTQAQAYLEARGVQATWQAESGPVAETILQVAAAYQSNLIIMGGYGATPVLEVVLGSAVDQILRQARQPLLICR
jgi:nucleotide-binding universal stress UspA family protein